MQTEDPADYLGDEIHLEECQSYILSQLQDREKSSALHGLPPPGPAVTISYQSGSGEHEVATRLAKILQSAEPKGAVQWTVFDRHLVEKVLEEHHLPQSLAKFLTEDRRSLLEDARDELLGLRPPSWVVVPQITETVLHLADAGHVILVGRGANFITARLPNVFHVHLIAALPGRIARVQRLDHLTPEEAAKAAARSDRGRGRYVKAHFHVCVDDDLLYHLVINTDRFPCQDAAQLIADGARRCFQSSAGGKE
jgi:cytidylate kinase